MKMRSLERRGEREGGRQNVAIERNKDMRRVRKRRKE
jgi:hypothetical protein